METSAVILAGGLGRRMGGCNKALLPYDNETFIERQIRACMNGSDEIIIVSNNDAVLAGLQTDCDHLKVVPDRYAGEGPLAGLQAGFTAASRPYVWLLACDQPLANADAAALLLKRLKQANATAALPLLAGRTQPLHAVYRRQETAVLANELLMGGERRLHAMLNHIYWVGVNEDEFGQYGISTRFADDVDTPEDYDRILGKSRCDIRGKEEPI